MTTEPSRAALYLTLDRKGHVTLPEEVRASLGLEPGDLVLLERTERGTYELVPACGREAARAAGALAGAGALGGAAGQARWFAAAVAARSTSEARIDTSVPRSSVKRTVPPASCGWLRAASEAPPRRITRCCSGPACLPGTAACATGPSRTIGPP